MTESIKETVKKTSVVWTCAILCAMLEFFLARFLAGIDEKNGLNAVWHLIGPLLLLCLAIILLRYFAAEKGKMIAFDFEKKLSDFLLLKEKKPLSNDDSKWLTLVLSDCQLFASEIPLTLTSLLSGISSFVAALFFGVFTSVPLTLIIIVLSLMSFFGPKIFGRLILSSQEEKQSSQEKLQTMLSSLFNAKDYLRINDRKSFGVDLFKRSYQEFLENQYKNSMIQWRLATSSVFFGLLFDVLSLVTEVYLISINQLTVGQFISFTLLTNSFTWMFYEAPSYYADLKRQRVSEKRIEEFLNQKEVRGIQKHVDDQRVAFDGVDFSYENGKEKVLSNLSFSLDLAQNVKVALVGKSGCGKSTILKLLNGDLIPDSGEIVIPKEYVDSTELVSLIPQKNQIFKGSVKENILLGRNISEEKLRHVTEVLGIDDLCASFEDRMDHQLENGGKNLSAGQRQLIGIARVLVDFKPLILLDEPLANLDAKTERRVVSVLSGLDCSVLMVTHRTEGLFGSFSVMQME